MADQPAAAPRQGLAAWIVSGSLALVMVIGGAVAFNSGEKSAEDGNPSANQTVAPGGGHTSPPLPPEPSRPKLADPAPPPVIDPTVDPDTVSVPDTTPLPSQDADQQPGVDEPGREPRELVPSPESRQAQALIADIVAPLGPTETPSTIALTETAEPTPIPPGPSPSDLLPPVAPEPEILEPEMVGPEIIEPEMIEPEAEEDRPALTSPTTAPPPSAPSPTPEPPIAASPDADFRPSAQTPRFADVTASWSPAGDALRVSADVPESPGSYRFGVTVNDTPFSVRVEVGADQRVRVHTEDGARNPYTYDRSAGRITGRFVPADFGFDSPAFPSRATVRIWAGEGATVEHQALPQAPRRNAALPPETVAGEDSTATPAPTATPTATATPCEPLCRFDVSHRLPRQPM